MYVIWGKCVAFFIVLNLLQFGRGNREDVNIGNEVQRGFTIGSGYKSIKKSTNQNVDEFRSTVIDEPFDIGNNFYNQRSSQIFSYEDQIPTIIWPQNEMTTNGHLKDLSFTRNDVRVESNVLKVNFGKDTYVDPQKHLKIRVKRFHKCIVRVIGQRDYKTSPGALIPTTFNCKFSNTSVIYRHYGARNPSGESIKLLIKYETMIRTYIVPTTIRIKVVYDKQLEIVTKNLPLKVDPNTKTSDQINESNTMFLYNENESDCYVTILSYMFPLPEYGMMASDKKDLELDPALTCVEFLSTDIVYQHRFINSTKTDSIPLKIELISKQDRKVINREFFHKIVLIPRGKINTSPSIETESSLVLDVNHLGLTAITANVIRITDLETPHEKILVTMKNQPSTGVIVSTDNPKEPITSFYQRDIQDYKIVYKTPNHLQELKSASPFYVTMQAIDTDGLVSEEFVLTINFVPINLNVSTLETGLQLFEGQSETFNISNFFQHVDNDTILRDPYLEVLNIPKSGGIIVGNKHKSTFKLSDLMEGRVKYEHWGDSNTTDNLLIKMTDSEKKIMFLLPIELFPVDNDPPVLIINKAIHATPGGVINIPDFMLMAFDTDSDDAKINFHLQNPYPKYGEFMLRQKSTPKNPSSYNYIDGFYEKTVNHWTQQDIQNGFLFYFVSSYKRFVNGSDVTYLTLSDRSYPPNHSITYKFKIHITPDLKNVPYLYSKTNLTMSILELQTIRVSDKILTFAGKSTDAADIFFVTELDSAVGKFTHIDDPSTSIVTFTQAQINSNAILYTPPPTEVGLIAKELQVNFTVFNKKYKTNESHILFILLQPVNNKPPSIRGTNLVLMNEKNEITFSTDQIQLTDEDTNLDKIIFRLVTTPKSGNIFYNTIPLRPGSEFTIKDIENDSISYRSKVGHDTAKDTFSLEVDDRVHQVLIPFTVVPEIEKIIGDLAHEDVESQIINVDEGGRVAISQNVWTLKPSEDVDIGFIIEEAPILGRIERLGQFIIKFTWRDIFSGNIYYLHDGNEIGPTPVFDNFTLIVTDLKSKFTSQETDFNRVTLKVKINPVNNIAPMIKAIQPLRVFETKQTTVTSENILVLDSDTENANLICLITKQPEYGYIVRSQNITDPIASFTIMDLKNDNIIFYQSIYRRIEPKSDLITLRCSDGLQDSPEMSLPIIIKPLNDEKPSIQTQDLIINEGELISISENNIKVQDLDEPTDQLVFTLSKQPNHGYISCKNTNKPILSFTLHDLQNNELFYQHDHTDDVLDNIQIELSDGNKNHSQLFQLSVKILSVDDESPQLLINHLLTLKLKESSLITANELLSIDSEYDNSGVKYEIVESPKFGVLQLLNSKSYLPLRNLTIGSVFTQENIDSGVIHYQNYEFKNGEDNFKFKLFDNSSNYYNNQDLKFLIEIEPKDLAPPTVVSKGVTIVEEGTLYLTPEILNSYDAYASNESLNYIILEDPNEGVLQNVDYPKNIVKTFSQLDINKKRIIYIPDQNSAGKNDSFEFAVTDGFHEVRKTFDIYIANKKNPSLVINDIHVRKGHSKIITNSDLHVINVGDWRPEQLIYIVTHVPRFGSIIQNTKKLVRQFSQDDIETGKISYRHDGSSNMFDRFGLRVIANATDKWTSADGEDLNYEISDTRPITVKIDPSSKETSKLTINDGVVELEPRSENSTRRWKGIRAKLVFRITKRNLNVHNSNASSVIYIIDEQPKYGYVCHLGNIEERISTFTQDEVNKDVIRFILNRDTKRTVDEFTFRVMDEGLNIWPPRKFHLEWSIICLEKDVYEVNEGESLVIHLLRKGSLKSTSSVNVSIYNATGFETKGELEVPEVVRFESGQRRARWVMQTKDDRFFEGPETVYLKLGTDVSALVGEPNKALVTINDKDDESIVEFTITEMKVRESSKKIDINLLRMGDLSKYLDVMCITNPVTANGTQFGGTEDFTDFISRGNDVTSMIRFNPGLSYGVCSVNIIDDYWIENLETFEVRLISAIGGQIGTKDRVIVTIEDDIEDYPRIYFGRSEYTYEEHSTSPLKVWILRSGKDLSRTSKVQIEVQRSTRHQKGGSVGTSWRQPGYDGQVPPYTVVFPPDSESQPLLVSQEVVKSTKPLVLRLINTEVGRLEDKREATIHLKRKPKEVTVFEFTDHEYRVKETTRGIQVPIRRTGSLRSKASVRCSTKGSSAKEGIHFVPRPDSYQSQMTFENGISEVFCGISLVDNEIYEKTKQFFVYLSSSETSSSGGEASIGTKSRARVIIEDGEDQPRIFFEKQRMTIDEPSRKGEKIPLKFTIKREGDKSDGILFRIFTQDSSAKAGEDYESINQELFMRPHESYVESSVLIFGDSKEELRETFTINLHIMKISSNHNVEGTSSQAIVLIQDPLQQRDLAFTAPPVVVSLEDYETNLKMNQSTIASGQTVICVTSCNPYHPLYFKTREHCQTHSMKDQLTSFQWHLTTKQNQNQKEFVEISPSFLSSSENILESFYVTSNSVIRCQVTPKTPEGQKGQAVFSTPVEVATKGGICPRRNNQSDGDSYVAKVNYLDSSDKDHPNTVAIEVLIPHLDGMIPLISTSRISDIQKLFSINALRISTHKCSNLVDLAEHQVQFGFFSSQLNILSSGNHRTRLFDRNKRFYRNLHLESCLWRWKGYFTLEELVSQCGAEVSNVNDINLIKSPMSFSIPLYVTLAHYSLKTDEEGWKPLHHQSNLRLSLTYVASKTPLTSISLKPSTPEEGKDAPPLSGLLQLKGIRTDENGRLSIDFETQPNFNGSFLLSEPRLNKSSKLESLDNPNHSFTLERQTPSMSLHRQRWTFTSDSSIVDYSGSYKASLIPCIYSNYIDSCKPKQEVEFEFNVALNQVMNPVAERFSLNTRLLIARSDHFMTNLSQTMNEEAIFYPGDRIYGGVFVDPIDSLGDGLKIFIEKCYVCSGLDGYVPKFDPENGEFGCIGDANNISSFKIIDRSEPEKVDKLVQDIPFDAKLFQPRRKTRSLNGKIDAFSFQGTPLYQVPNGDRWFVHVIFMIKKYDKSTSRLFRRHAYVLTKSELEDQLQIADSKDTKTIKNIGTKGLGTNMHDFYLKKYPTESNFTLIDWTFLNHFAIIFLIVASIILCTVVILSVIYTKKKTGSQKGFYATLPMSELKSSKFYASASSPVDVPKDRPKVLSFYSSNDDITEI